MASIKIGRKILVSEMAPHVHSFEVGENKVNKIVNWLKSWIQKSLETGKIQQFDLLPSKAELAYHIGVSQGTVQNVFRQLEDSGIVESKQKIGTYIKINDTVKTEKLTSKREMTVEIVKKYIQDKKYKCNSKISSAREIAKQINIPYTTVRLAIMHLVANGILKQVGRDFVLNSNNYDVKDITTRTLVEKVAQNIEKYIHEKLKPEEKLPTNNELSQMFNSSVKTIHDSIKLLSQKGVVYTRRGRYGTIVAGSKEDIELYNYEKYAVKIRNYIREKSKVGDKLPSIKTFATMYNTSEKTIKKALDIFAEDGYITYSRGRYGGTFVMDIPPEGGDAYKWLALNSEYISNLDN
ncbi:MAG: GntR family transcriptional regulator [bacterium]|nr:GntR family transcriptional regulator [bacterium]